MRGHVLRQVGHVVREVTLSRQVAVPEAALRPQHRPVYRTWNKIQSLRSLAPPRRHRDTPFWTCYNRLPVRRWVPARPNPESVTGTQTLPPAPLPDKITPLRPICPNPCRIPPFTLRPHPTPNPTPPPTLTHPTPISRGAGLPRAVRPMPHRGLAPAAAPPPPPGAPRSARPPGGLRAPAPRTRSPPRAMTATHVAPRSTCFRSGSRRGTAAGLRRERNRELTRDVRTTHILIVSGPVNPLSMNPRACSRSNAVPFGGSALE